MGTPRGQLDWVGDLESPARPPLSKLRSKLTSAMERLREAENLAFEEPFHFTQIDGLEKRITELWEEIRRAGGGHGRGGEGPALDQRLP